MKKDLKLDANAYLPLRDVVFNTLREAILRGELLPGERLMELQLAAQLGVSRTPVREAIRMLVQEGLAVTTIRKGAEVAKMTLKDMEDVLEIRETLDELAVALACERITDEQIERLGQKKEEFEKSLKSEDVKKIAEADVKLQTLLNNLREQIYRYRVEYIKSTENHPILIHEHEAIYHSLVNRNVEDAKASIREHVKNQATAVKEVIVRQE